MWPEQRNQLGQCRFRIGGRQQRGHRAGHRHDHRLGAGRRGRGAAAFAKEFEAANPGVKVQVTAIPWDAAHNKYQTAIAGGKTPDVAQMGTTWMGELRQTRSTRPPTSIDKPASSPAR